MKKVFSTKWKGSKQPRKQRKYREKAPMHIRMKFLNVNLAKPLRKNAMGRSIILRKGDIVKVMRGKFKKTQGKVLEINVKKQKIIVEGIQKKKMDGSKVAVPLRPSNLQIIELNLEDKKRVKNQGKEIKSPETEQKSKSKTGVKHAPKKTADTK